MEKPLHFIDNSGLLLQKEVVAMRQNLSLFWVEEAGLIFAPRLCLVPANKCELLPGKMESLTKVLSQFLAVANCTLHPQQTSGRIAIIDSQ